MGYYVSVFRHGMIFVRVLYKLYNVNDCAYTAARVKLRNW